jgi:hypothetical protein
MTKALLRTEKLNILSSHDARPGNAPPRQRGSPPARVRRGFRKIHAKAAQPAGAPKPLQARPRPATRLEEPPPAPDTTWGTTKRGLTLKTMRERAG